MHDYYCPDPDPLYEDELKELEELSKENNN